MQIDELKKLIGDKLDWNQFGEAISEESDVVYVGNDEVETSISDALSLSYEIIDIERDYDSMFYRFRIDGVAYETTGTYDSWNGQEMDDIKDFYEVKPVEKTITVWEAV